MLGDAEDLPNQRADRRPGLGVGRNGSLQGRGPVEDAEVPPDILTFAPVRSRKLHSLSARFDGSPTRL
jgi:hypothetical protein